MNAPMRTALVAIVFSTGTCLAQSDPNDIYWDQRFAGPGVDGHVNVTLSTPQGLIVAGEFTSVDGVSARNIAILRSSPPQWLPLGDGVNGEVFAVELSGNQLYVGGAFDTAGTVYARNIAMWDIGTNTWSSFVSSANGVDSTVRALRLFAGKLAVGGDFRHAGASQVSGLALLNPVNGSFSPMGTVSVANDDVASVYAFEVLGSELWAGGRFDAIDGMTAQNVARWNGTDWQPIGMDPIPGVNGRVHALLADGGDMYVAGEFIRAGLNEIVGVAKWIEASEAWQGLVVPTQGLRGSAYALASFGGDLIVGGPFVGAGFLEVTGIVKWRGGTWSKLEGDLQGTVNALAVHNGKVIAGGDYAGVAGLALFSLGAWDAVSWSAVAGDVGGAGPVGPVFALLRASQGIYAAGNFLAVGGISAGRIARYDPVRAAWDTLEAGVDGPVYALATAGGMIVAGGRFSGAGDAGTSNIALFNPTTRAWSALGVGLDEGVSGTVEALAVDGNTLYVGGDFRIRYGGLAIDNLAAYDLTSFTWSDPGPSPDGPVHALTMSGGKLIVGGDFRSIGDVTAQNIAQLTVKSRLWEPLGSGVGAPVYALASNGSSVYVGGSFATAGVLSAPLVARWNSEIGYWDRMGQGLEGSLEAGVHGLSVGGGAVWATGTFSASGTTSLKNVARWDTITMLWEPLGSGIDGGLAPAGRAVTAGDNDVYVGGAFAHAGGRFTPFLARYSRTTATTPHDRSAGPSWLVLHQSDEVSILSAVDGLPIRATLFDVNGKAVWSAGDASRIVIPRSGLCTGVYVLVVASGARSISGTYVAR